MKYNNITETIGNTPIIKINHLFPVAKEKKIHVWVKVERFNPGSSIKDRIALAMIEDAQEKGLLNQNSTIIEPTSGNTGIGLAMVAAAKGLRLIITMPESMSIERRKIMSAYGAQLVLTPKEKGMKGAIDKAHELAQKTSNSWVPMQFENESNPLIHEKTTAREIVKDFPEGLDYLITGVGTGGHITGCARELKKQWPKLQVFAVEPSDSPVISGGAAGPHAIQGIGAGFIPKVFDLSLIDGSIQISKEDAFRLTQESAHKEALFLGISSGASLAAIEAKIASIPEGSNVLTIAYDTGERYLSVDGLFEQKLT